MSTSTAGTRRRRAALVVALLLAAPGALEGQRPEELAPGSRVRVTAPRYFAEPYVGSLVRLTSDSITLHPESGGSALTLSLARVHSLELSAGEKSKVVTGAAVGFGLGATASLLFLAGFCGGDTVCGGDEWLRAFAVIALPPTLVGAAIGLMIRTEQWRVVQHPARAPQPFHTPRWQLGLSLPF